VRRCGSRAALVSSVVCHGGVSKPVALCHTTSVPRNKAFSFCVFFFDKYLLYYIKNVGWLCASIDAEAGPCPFSKKYKECWY
jgi:hypothetical protein